MDKQGLHYRKVPKTTSLESAAEIRISVPDTAYGRSAAERIRSSLRNHCRQQQISVIYDMDTAVMRNGECPLIIAGNLSDSRCVRWLYYNFLCVTDCWYPGPGGYELRTLLDPFGKGHDVIFIGYSDKNGLAMGVEILEQKMEGNLPHLCEVECNRFHLPAPIVENTIKQQVDAGDPELHHSDLLDRKGYLAYMSNSRELFEEYCSYWKIILDQKIVTNHLKLFQRVCIWRMLELSGMTDSTLYERILNYFFQWANGPEGIGFIDTRSYQSNDYPRQNHGLTPAMGLLHLYKYFHHYHPSITEAEHWKAKAEKVFSVYNNGSWKHACDGLCHGWWMAQPIMLDYGFFDEEHRYFEKGGALKAAQCAAAVVNNAGWMPAAGDSMLSRALPWYNLVAGAHYYNAGEYLFVKNLSKILSEGLLMVGNTIPRKFDSGVGVKRPENKILTIIPVDPLIYRIWDKEPELAPNILPTPPYGEIERCFDKLSFRTGWGKEDEYLLMDGLGGGNSTHSYSDAMSVLDYSKYHISFLVQEDGMYRPENENHCMAIIYNNAEKKPIPAFAEIIKADEDGKGNLHVCMRLKNYSGADWTREIFLMKDKFLVFNDVIEINEDGLYAIETHFRTPGRVDLNGNKIVSHRRDLEGREYIFNLWAFASEKCAIRADVVDLSDAYGQKPGVSILGNEKIASELYRERYGMEETVLTDIATRIARSTCKGDSVSFTHVLQARKDRDADLKILDCSEKAILIQNGKDIVKCSFDHIPHKISGLNENIQNRMLPVRISLCGENNCFFIGKSDVKVFKKQGDYILAGTSSGEACVFDGSLKPVLKLDMQECIHDISINESTGQLAVSYGKSNLAVMDAEGKMVWDRRIERTPTMFPWWETRDPLAVNIEMITGREGNLLLAGCGDNFLKMFNMEGQLLWEQDIVGGIPCFNHVLENSEGTPGGIFTCLGMRAYDSASAFLSLEGKEILRLPGQKWTSKNTCMHVVREGEELFVTWGGNMRDNFHFGRMPIYKIDRFVCGMREDSLFERTFSKSVAGTVNAIAVNAIAGTVAAGTSQGYVIVYSLLGEQRGVRLFENPVKKVIIIEGCYFVLDEKGTLYEIGSKGEYCKEVGSCPAIRHFEQWKGRGAVCSKGNKAYALSL